MISRSEAVRFCDGRLLTPDSQTIVVRMDQSLMPDDFLKPNPVNSPQFMKSYPCRPGNVRAFPISKHRGGIWCVLFGVALVLSACSTIVNQSVPFSSADFSAFEAPGTAVISGHAFVRSDTGMKRGAAGIRVNLVPLTAYTEERAKIMESGKDPAPADPGLEKYTRTTVGDWGGGYQFAGLPAGKYLIYCKIKWEQRFAGNRMRDGSGDLYALARVQVSNGEHKSVVATNLDQN